MPKFRVEILPLAWQDLNNIADYHLQMAGKSSAEKITNRILDYLEKLQSFPLIGSIHPDPVLSKMEYRKILCGDYICIYRLIDKSVYIYRILHQSTNYPKFFK